MENTTANKKFINETDQTSGDTIKGIVTGVGIFLSALAGAKIQNAFAAKSSDEDIVDYQ